MDKLEPVAWRYWGYNAMHEKAWVYSDEWNPYYSRMKAQPLYVAPPQREWKGLTDEETRGAAQVMDAEPLAEGWKELIKFASAIEQALKDKNT